MIYPQSTSSLWFSRTGLPGTHPWESKVFSPWCIFLKDTLGGGNTAGTTNAPGPSQVLLKHSGRLGEVPHRIIVASVLRTHKIVFGDIIHTFLQNVSRSAINSQSGVCEATIFSASGLYLMCQEVSGNHTVLKQGSGRATMVEQVSHLWTFSETQSVSLLPTAFPESGLGSPQVC